MTHYDSFLDEIMADMVKEALGHMETMENRYIESHPKAQILPAMTEPEVIEDSKPEVIEDSKPDVAVTGNEPVTASESESECEDTDQFAPRNDPSRLSVNEKV